ncbi:MAG: biopolymer transporter ExbD [Prevotella sp.]|nr:biopolymer transporter ExbD [Prevotella sp.]
MRFERNRGGRRQPELNMSSLPDLIFTVLFFFMIVTTMRSVPQKVGFQVPTGTELAKFKKQPSTLYLFIGRPVRPHGASSENNFVVQVDDKLVPLDGVASQVSRYMEELLPDEREELTVMMKIDENVPMGMVTSVKQQLRKAGALKVHYAAAKHRNIPTSQ